MWYSYNSYYEFQRVENMRKLSQRVRVNLRKMFDMHQRNFKLFCISARWLGQFEFTWPIDDQQFISIKRKTLVSYYSNRFFDLEKIYKMTCGKITKRITKSKFSGTLFSDSVLTQYFRVRSFDGSFTEYSRKSTHDSCNNSRRWWNRAEFADS